MEQQTNRVIIKRKPRQTWSGKHRYPGTTHTLTVPMDKITGNYITGLSDKKRKDLEKATGFNLSADRSNTFWRDFKITFIEGEDKILDLNDPRHEIEYHVLGQHNLVITDKSQEPVKSKAEYVVFDEFKEAKDKNIDRKITTQAWVYYDKMAPDEMRDLCLLVPKLASKARTASDEVVKKYLGDFIEEDSRNRKLFIALYEDKGKNDKIFIEKLVASNILRKNGTSFYYGEEVLGHDLPSTIDYINDPKNSNLKKALFKSLESSKI